MGHEYIKESETFNTSRNGTVPKPTASDISNNKVLGASGNWVAQSGGGGGGSSTLAGLDDVDTTGVSDGDLLGYDSNSGKWIPQTSSNGHNYSTTEQVVGTWIDGKTVYERVFNLSNALNISPNTWTDTEISNSNISTILSASAINSTGTLFNFIAASRDSGSYIKLLQTRSTSISINILILSYTKTTD